MFYFADSTAECVRTSPLSTDSAHSAIVNSNPSQVKITLLLVSLATLTVKEYEQSNMGYSGPTCRRNQSNPTAKIAKDINNSVD